MADDPLVGILACPACADRPPLRRAEDAWICQLCGRRYPIVNGIPYLTLEDAVLPESTNNNP